MSASIPPGLAPTLQALLQARYGPEQREECAGWRGLFEKTVAEDGSTVLVATRDVETCETIFLIDHLWCTTLVEARKQLQEHSVVRRNLQTVLGIDDESESEGDDDDDDDDSEKDDDSDDEEEANALTAAQQPMPPDSETSSKNEDEAMRSRLLAFLGLEDAAVAALITDVDLDDITAHPPPDPAFLSYLLWAVPRLFPNAEALSLRSLGVGEERAAEVKAMVAALPRLKALWLNGNDVARVLDKDATLHARLQILNRKLTRAYSEWALRYLAFSSPQGEGEEEGPTRLDLAGRGLTLLKPQAFAALPSLRALDLSRNAGLPLPVVDESDPSLLALLHALPRLTSLRLDAVSPEGETRLAQAFPHLRWINGRYITRIRVGEGSPPTTVLLDEPDHMGDGKTRRRQEIVDKVLMRGWARLEPMRLAGPTAQHHAELHWCLLDLPGLALGHDEEGGNIALLHMRDRRLGVTFTAAWPRVRIRAGERVTRDYLEGFPPAARAAVAPARLLDCLYGPRLARRLLPLSSGGESGGGAAVGEVKPEEEAPELEGGEAGTEPTFPIDAPFLAPTRPLLVFTDMPVLRESLGLPALFAFTDDAAGADIVWTAAASPAAAPQQQRQQQWRGTLPKLEAVDDKCGMARLLRHGGPRPRWLPQTFCLPEELPALLLHWCGCDGDEELGKEERLWILKPPHLARGWDIALASELSCVLRHLQASGRLSVSRYLPRPALWSDGHKYDLRFYALLLSPTKVLIHDHFRVRRAAQPYSLQRAHRQELRRHLTNTTLGACTEDETEQEEEEEEEAGCPTETLHMDDFIAGFPTTHRGKPAWSEVRARIEGMLADCFARLAVAEGGLGARPDPYGRALLGVDVLLDGDTLEPYLLELNAAPNVIGIVRERPSFFDEVFTAAFVRGGGANCVAGGGGFRPLTQSPEAESRELV